MTGTSSLMNYSKTRRSKFISVFTLVIFIFSCISPSVLRAAPPQAQISHNHPTVTIPPHVGTIQDTFTTQEGRKPFIIHIHDA